VINQRGQRANKGSEEDAYTEIERGEHR
jgi:hypothetical protein